MAAKKEVKKVAATQTEAFKEFSMEGKTFSYKGRVYPKKEGTGKVLSRSLVNITLNDVITIKGIYLVETEDKFFLTFPQYKSGEEYKSYFFIDRDFNEGELDQLIDIIADNVYA